MKDYDKRAIRQDYHIGEWVLPAEETGRMHKLSRSWHEPYHAGAGSEWARHNNREGLPPTGWPNPDLQNQSHPLSGCLPRKLLLVYGDRHVSPGCPPRWVNKLLQDQCPDGESCQEVAMHGASGWGGNSSGFH